MANLNFNQVEDTLNMQTECSGNINSPETVCTDGANPDDCKRLFSSIKIEYPTPPESLLSDSRFSPSVVLTNLHCSKSVSLYDIENEKSDRENCDEHIDAESPLSEEKLKSYDEHTTKLLLQGEVSDTEHERTGDDENYVTSIEGSFETPNEIRDSSLALPVFQADSPPENPLPFTDTANDSCFDSNGSDKLDFTDGCTNLDDRSPKCNQSDNELDTFPRIEVIHNSNISTCKKRYLRDVTDESYIRENAAVKTDYSDSKKVEPSISVEFSDLKDCSSSASSFSHQENILHTENTSQQNGATIPLESFLNCSSNTENKEETNYSSTNFDNTFQKKMNIKTTKNKQKKMHMKKLAQKDVMKKSKNVNNKPSKTDNSSENCKHSAHNAFEESNNLPFKYSYQLKMDIISRVELGISRRLTRTSLKRALEICGTEILLEDGENSLNKCAKTSLMPKDSPMPILERADEPVLQNCLSIHENVVKPVCILPVKTANSDMPILEKELPNIPTKCKKQCKSLRKKSRRKLLKSRKQRKVKLPTLENKHKESDIKLIIPKLKENGKYSQGKLETQKNNIHTKIEDDSSELISHFIPALHTENENPCKVPNHYQSSMCKGLKYADGKIGKEVVVIDRLSPEILYRYSGYKPKHTKKDKVVEEFIPNGLTNSLPCYSENIKEEKCITEDSEEITEQKSVELVEKLILPKSCSKTVDDPIINTLKPPPSKKVKHKTKRNKSFLDNTESHYIETPTEKTSVLLNTNKQTVEETIPNISPEVSPSNIEECKNKSLTNNFSSYEHSDIFSPELNGISQRKIKKLRNKSRENVSNKKREKLKDIQKSRWKALQPNNDSCVYSITRVNIKSPLKVRIKFPKHLYSQDNNNCLSVDKVTLRRTRKRNVKFSRSKRKNVNYRPNAFNHLLQNDQCVSRTQQKIQKKAKEDAERKINELAEKCKSFEVRIERINLGRYGISNESLISESKKDEILHPERSEMVLSSENSEPDAENVITNFNTNLPSNETCPPNWRINNKCKISDTFSKEFHDIHKLNEGYENETFKLFEDKKEINDCRKMCSEKKADSSSSEELINLEINEKSPSNKLSYDEISEADSLERLSDTEMNSSEAIGYERLNYEQMIESHSEDRLSYSEGNHSKSYNEGKISKLNISENVRSTEINEIETAGKLCSVVINKLDLSDRLNYEEISNADPSERLNNTSQLLSNSNINISVGLTYDNISDSDTSEKVNNSKTPLSRRLSYDEISVSDLSDKVSDAEANEIDESEQLNTEINTSEELRNVEINEINTCSQLDCVNELGTSQHLSNAEMIEMDTSDQLHSAKINAPEMVCYDEISESDTSEKLSNLETSVSRRISYDEISVSDLSDRVSNSEVNEIDTSEQLNEEIGEINTSEHLNDMEINEMATSEHLDNSQLIEMDTSVHLNNIKINAPEMLSYDEISESDTSVNLTNMDINETGTSENTKVINETVMPERLGTAEINLSDALVYDEISESDPFESLNTEEMNEMGTSERLGYGEVSDINTSERLNCEEIDIPDSLAENKNAAYISPNDKFIETASTHSVLTTNSSHLNLSSVNEDDESEKLNSKIVNELKLISRLTGNKYMDDFDTSPDKLYENVDNVSSFLRDLSKDTSELNLSLNNKASLMKNYCTEGQKQLPLNKLVNESKTMINDELRISKSLFKSCTEQSTENCIDIPENSEHLGIFSNEGESGICSDVASLPVPCFDSDIYQDSHDVMWKMSYLSPAPHKSDGIDSPLNSLSPVPQATEDDSELGKNRLSASQSAFINIDLSTNFENNFLSNSSKFDHIEISKSAENCKTMQQTVCTKSLDVNIENKDAKTFGSSSKFSDSLNQIAALPGENSASNGGASSRVLEDFNSDVWSFVSRNSLTSNTDTLDIVREMDINSFCAFSSETPTSSFLSSSIEERDNQSHEQMRILPNIDLSLASSGSENNFFENLNSFKHQASHTATVDCFKSVCCNDQSVYNGFQEGSSIFGSGDALDHIRASLDADFY